MKIFWDELSKFFILEHSRPQKLKIFFNHGENILRWAVQILHSGAFHTTKMKTFIQPWWIYSEISCPNPSFWRIPDHENQKFSSTMVNIFWDMPSKSFILEHSRPQKSKFSSIIVKIFWDKRSKLFGLGHSASWKSKKIFNHGEYIHLINVKLHKGNDS